MKIRNKFMTHHPVIRGLVRFIRGIFALIYALVLLCAGMIRAGS